MNYPLNHKLNPKWQRLVSPACLLSMCLSASFLASPGVPAQNSVLTPPHYSDLGEDAGLYDTAPRSANSANNAAAGVSNGFAGNSFNNATAQPPQEKNLRNLIRSLGVDSRHVQDMVVAHISTEMQLREPMRNASSRLFQAMNKPGVTDAQLGVLLNDCRVAYESDKARRTDTLEALKAQIGAHLTPRTESMLFLLGLEGDVVITLPTPTLLTQMQRDRQRLFKEVEGLKLEADSLRRERDEAKAEFHAYQVAIQAGVAGNAAKAPVNVVASAQINPHSSSNSRYAVNGNQSVENLTAEQKEISRLLEENADLKKDKKRLQREITSLERALKKADGNEKRDSEKESKNKAEKR